MSIDARLLPKDDARVVELEHCCKVPRKDIAEFIAHEVLHDRDLMDEKRGHLRLDFEFDPEFVLFGNVERSKYRKPKEANRRLYTRVPQELHDRIEKYALGLGGASATATVGLLVQWGLRSSRIMREFLKEHPPTDPVRRERMRAKWRLWFPEESTY